MNLLFLISSMDGGGAARIVGNITSHLPDDWNIDILVNNSDTVSFPYKGNMITLGADRPVDTESVLYQMKILVKRLHVLKSMKASGKYDACISYMDSANFSNLLCHTPNCKTVLNIVNNMTSSAQFHWKYKYLVNPVIRLFYNKADHIIPLSEDVRQDMIKSYGLRPELMTVSYCSIDVKAIDRLIAEQAPGIIDEWFDKDHTVVTAGRMDKQKGQWHLIRAFSRVVQAIPEAKLAVFGNGPMREYYERLIRDYGIENNVKLFGFSPDLTAYISKSALFVFPSLHEGFGTALQEALACNVACVATDYVSGGREQLSPDYTGEVRGIYEGEYGILIESCSGETPEADVPLDAAETAMADAIIDLLTDRAKREAYAIKARERCYEYDIDLIAEKWINDISSL